MKILQTLICFFFLSLWDGNTGFIEAEIHKGTEGGNITVLCNFFFTGSKKIFCRRECEGKDLLVETTGNSAQRGRYSIKYKPADRLLGYSVMNVTIRNLTKSDSGQYRCRLDRKFQPDSKEDFEIRVQSEDARVTSKPKPNLRPSTSTPTTTQSLSSSPGSSSPGSSSPGSSTHPSASPETTNQPEHPQPAAGELLYVGLTLVVMIIILSAAMVILFKKGARKSKEPPVETDYVNVTEANRDYEIIEDRPIGSGPVELCTVYTCASFTKPNAVETTAANCTEDSRKVVYTEMDFSNCTAGSLNSAPRRDADDVIYSAPRAAARSDGSYAGDASPPLYSTVTLRRSCSFSVCSLSGQHLNANWTELVAPKSVLPCDNL